MTWPASSSVPEAGALESARTIQTEGMKLEVEVWPDRTWASVERLMLGLGGGPFCALPLTRSQCNYGGDRPWFLCSVCGRRAGKLYILIDEVATSCHRCAQLGYPAEHETHRDRLRRKARKIRDRLLWQQWDEAPVKPIGMHWKTYSDLVHTAAIAERIVSLLDRT